MRLTANAPTRPATLEAKVRNRSGASITILTGLILIGVAWLDRATGELPIHHFYYLPIILAAVRFRQRGGLPTAVAAGLLYYLANQHVLNWHYLERDLMRLAIFLAIGWVTARLVEDADQMRRLAHTDDLTGLHNLRSFEASYVALCAEAIAAGTSLTLLVLDLDRLKALNAQYGHLAGAQAIQALGQIIAQAMPADALACRYGGDEFAVALPICSAQQGLETAQRIRTSLAELAPTLAGQALPADSLNTSIGVATFVPIPTEDALELGEALFQAADQALYQAKAQGRNLVCHYHQLSLAPPRETALPELLSAYYPHEEEGSEGADG